MPSSSTAVAPGPQFAKVFVRLVDWEAAEQLYSPSTIEGEVIRCRRDTSEYEHSTWRDPFTVVELPTPTPGDPSPTVDMLTTLAVCRWGRGVISYAWLFASDCNGRRIDWNPTATVDASVKIDNQSCVAVAADTPLDPDLPLAHIPLVELPRCFVLMTRPSKFVPQVVVCKVLSRMQDIIQTEKLEPKRLMREARQKRDEIAAVRAANVTALEEARKRNEVKSILHAHQVEDARLVAMGADRRRS